MEAEQYIAMLQDKHFLDLKKMEYKYGQDSVQKMLDLLELQAVKPLPLSDFTRQEKLRYLADAPQQDPEGNKTMVRFSRKTKQQYVSSEKDGKATGWSAFYVDGKWVDWKK